jgi:hypothetical protein
MSDRAKKAALAAAVVGTFVAAGTLGGAPASAGTGCETRAVLKAFAAWGDDNRYFRVPGGGFESGTSDAWSFAGGAGTTSGNEPWKVVSSADGRSARIPAGGSATSRTFCVASAEDALRWFVRRPGVRGAALHIHVRVTSGVNVATNDYDVDGSRSGWTPTERLLLPDIRDASGRQQVSVTFTARGTGATWLVDDVMLDPWRTL